MKSTIKDFSFTQFCLIIIYFDDNYVMSMINNLVFYEKLNILKLFIILFMIKLIYLIEIKLFLIKDQISDEFMK